MIFAFVRPLAVAAYLVLLSILLALGAAPAAAQQGPPRVLPAAASPPPDVVEEQRRAQQKIPAPPQKGKAAAGRRPLPAAEQPPQDVRADQQEAREIPKPPPRSNKQQLEQRLMNLPGGKERLEKARRKEPPGATRKEASQQDAQVSELRDVWGLLAQVGSILISDAHAQTALSFDLTPPTNWRHTGGSTASFYNAYVSNYTPNASYLQTCPYSLSYLGGTSQTPVFLLYLNVPADGWYIVNVNAYAYGANQAIDVRHYQSGVGYSVIENFSMVSGNYADYPFLEYLSAGPHYFGFTLTGNSCKLVSRISVDAYP